MSPGLDFNLYLPLAKVEQQKDGSVIVAGYASTEALDLDGEIIEKDAVKRALPGYWQWRNIREMHQPSAVGVAKEANIDTKGLWLTSRITDPIAAQKCLDEVYKGYSIGGKKLNKVGNRVTEIELVEVSIVDRPCNSECKFDIAKSAGAGAGAYLVRASRRPAASRALSKMAEAVEILAREKLEDGVEKREFSASSRRSAAASGAALPDGSFPIENREDLDNARQALGRAKDKSKARAHIVARAKDLGVKLPPKWKKREAKKILKDAERAVKSAAKPRLGSPPTCLPAQLGEVAGVAPAGLGEGGRVHAPALGRAASREVRLTKRERRVLKRMGTASQLAYCFDSIREAQRSLITESTGEGGDKKDRALAEKLGEVARQLASVIGEKATHEGEEASSLSDVDDKWVNSLLEQEVSKMTQTTNTPNALDQFLAELTATPLQKSRTPALTSAMKRGKGGKGAASRLAMARSQMKKARKSADEVEECMKAAYAALRKGLLAKAGKPKMDDDNDDRDDAMSKLAKAYGSLQAMKTFMKSANVQLKKAASGRSGQRGQEAGDPEAGVYEVPMGVKDLSPATLAGAGPGSPGRRGSQPPGPINMAGGDARSVKAAKGDEQISRGEAEALARAAAAEAKLDVLGKLPAPSGHRPLAFDPNRLVAGGGSGSGLGAPPEAEVLLKGVNLADLNSGDESRQNQATAKVLGNMILGGLGKSMFDPDFHGVAGAGGGQ